MVLVGIKSKVFFFFFFRAVFKYEGTMIVPAGQGTDFEDFKKMCTGKETVPQVCLCVVFLVLRCRTSAQLLGVSPPEVHPRGLHWRSSRFSVEKKALITFLLPVPHNSSSLHTHTHTHPPLCSPYLVL